MHIFGQKNLESFSNRPASVCLTALLIINKTRSHDVFNDLSRAGGMVVCKLIRTTNPVG
jgi:hypothetical protein